MKTTSAMQQEEELLDIMADMLEGGGTVFTEAQCDRIMADAEAMEACRQMAGAKMALATAMLPDIPDVDTQWQRFAQAHGISASGDEQTAEPQPQLTATVTETDKPRTSKRKSYLMRSFFWGASAGAAAMALIAILLFHFTKPNVSKGYMVYEAAPAPSAITLTTSSGKEIVMDNDECIAQLKNLDARVYRDEDDAFAMSYTSASATDAVETHRISMPHGKDLKLTLPDGTVVWLNSESSLEYPSRFEGDQRLVRLYGQAYFDVAKDAEHPFIIQTEKLQAKVLGTELNVRSYNEKAPQIALLTGSVAVSLTGSDRPGTKLVPGQSITLADDKLVVETISEPEAYIYWRDGYFYFDNATLVDIMQELGRWYNMNVVFETKELMNIHLHYFNLRSDSIEEAITALNYQPRINARIVNNCIYIK